MGGFFNIGGGGSNAVPGINSGGNGIYSAGKGTFGQTDAGLGGGMNFNGNSPMGKLSSGVSNLGGSLSNLNPFKQQPSASVTQVAGPNSQYLQQINPGQYQNALQGQSAAQMQAAQINPNDPRWAILQSGQQGAQNAQNALISQLSNQAAGIGPSVTQNQMQQTGLQNQQAAFAQMASQRGGYNPSNARTTMEQSANMGNQLAVNAGTARLQEQMQAAGMLGNTTNQARASDLATAQAQIGAAGQQAQLQQQAAQQNLGAQQSFQNLQQQYMQMGMTAQQANQNAAIAFSGQQQAANVANANAANQSALQSAKANQGMYGGMLGGLGSAAMRNAPGLSQLFGGGATASSVGGLGDTGDAAAAGEASQAGEATGDVIG